MINDLNITAILKHIQWFNNGEEKNFYVVKRKFENDDIIKSYKYAVVDNLDSDKRKILFENKEHSVNWIYEHFKNNCMG